MSKKDFIAIAAALKAAYAEAADATEHDDQLTKDVCKMGVEFAALQIAAACARSNPRFDRERFLTACRDN